MSGDHKTAGNFDVGLVDFNIPIRLRIAALLFLPLLAFVTIAVLHVIPILEQQRALERCHNLLQFRQMVIEARADLDYEQGWRTTLAPIDPIAVENSNQAIETLIDTFSSVHPQLEAPEEDIGASHFLTRLAALRAEQHQDMTDTAQLGRVLDQLDFETSEQMERAGYLDWFMLLRPLADAHANMDELRGIKDALRFSLKTETHPLALDRATEIATNFMLFERYFPRDGKGLRLEEALASTSTRTTHLSWKNLRERMKQPESIIGFSRPLGAFFAELDLGYTRHVQTLLERDRLRVRQALGKHVLMSTLLLLLCLVMGYVVYRSIVRPLIVMADSAHRLARGTFAPLPAYRARDEIGTLFNSFAALQGTMDRLNHEIGQLQQAAMREETEVRGNPNHLEGEWKQLVLGMNATVDTLHDIRHRLEGEMQKRLETEEALRQVQRLESLGQLAGGIAHDFNNLLTVIIGYTDEVQSQRIPEINEDLNCITRAAYQAQELVKQLMIVGRKEKIELQETDLSTGMDRFVRFISRTLPDHVEIKTIHQDERAVVMANEVLLGQVLLNLAMNASQAMTSGGSFTMSLSPMKLSSSPVAADWVEPGEFWTLSCADTGTGIPADIQDKIFDPFFTTKLGEGGTGLGLSMAWRILQQCGGWIEVDSSPAGTTFHLHFPRIEPSEAAMPTFESHPESTLPLEQSCQGNVLVVEDNPQVRLFTTRCLTRMGYEVFIAEDGREGLEIIAKRGEELDFILSDVLMPHCSGPDMITKANQANLVHCPVLFMSGYDDAQIDRFRNTSDCAQIPLMRKPFTFSQLGAFVQTGETG